jgi:hypothetical protein
VSAEGIWKREPSAESREVLPEAGEDYEDYEASEMEVLETMKAGKFDVVDNKVISQIQKNYKKSIVLAKNVKNLFGPHGVRTTSILPKEGAIRPKLAVIGPNFPQTSQLLQYWSGWSNMWPVGCTTILFLLFDT